MKIKYKNLEIYFDSGVEKMPNELKLIFDDVHEILQEAKDRMQRGVPSGLSELI